MAKSPNQKNVTKKHMARLERENQQRRRMIIAASIVGALIVLTLIFGILQQTVLKNLKTVAKVDGETIKAADFVKQVKFTRYNMINDAMQYEQLAQYFGDNAQITNYIQTLKSQLDAPETIGSQVLDEMINNIVLEKYAAEKGITITEADIQAEIAKQFSYFPDGTPTPENTATPYATATMNPTQYALVTATPTAEPTAEVTALPDAQTTEPTATLAAVEPTADLTATPLPTPTVYTEDAFKTNYNNALDRLSITGFNDQDLHDYFRTYLLRQKVLDQITATVPTDGEQVWARHILVDTIEAALAVKQRIDIGEDFAAIASEVSTDTSNKDQGGDLGWFGKNVMDPAFEEATYALNVGEISNPVQSQFGWHIIQLLGKEVRPLADNQLATEKQKVYDEWLTVEKENFTIEKLDDAWKSIVPSEPQYDSYVASLQATQIVQLTTSPQPTQPVQ